MAKPTFIDEFKQGVVQYVLDHPDGAKEIAWLKKELKDTQDALDVLKKAIGMS